MLCWPNYVHTLTCRRVIKHETFGTSNRETSNPPLQHVITAVWSRILKQQVSIRDWIMQRDEWKTYLSLPTECHSYQFAQHAHYLMPTSPSPPAKKEREINGFCIRPQMHLQEKNSNKAQANNSKLITTDLRAAMGLYELSPIWLIPRL